MAAARCETSLPFRVYSLNPRPTIVSLPQGERSIKQDTFRQACTSVLTNKSVGHHLGTGTLFASPFEFASPDLGF